MRCADVRARAETSEDTCEIGALRLAAPARCSTNAAWEPGSSASELCDPGAGATGAIHTRPPRDRSRALDEHRVAELVRSIAASLERRARFGQRRVVRERP